MAGIWTSITCLFRAKKQQKQERKLETEKQHDQKRQREPNGLLDLALMRSFTENSFTATDPGRFYRGHAFAVNYDPGDTPEGRITERDSTGFH